MTTAPHEPAGAVSPEQSSEAMPEAPGIPPVAKSPDLADTDALARPMPSLTTPTTPQLAEPSGPDEPTATPESGPPGPESEATPVVATSPPTHKEAEPPVPHESTPPAPSEPIPPAPTQAAPASPASHDAPSAVLTEVAAEVVLTEAQKRLCRIAETSNTDSENWQELRDLIAQEMHTILAAKIAALGPSSGPEGDKIREQVAAHEQRLTALLVEFPDPPFTIQRICELTTVHSHQYRTPSKYLRALEKVILVTSTVDQRSGPTEAPAPKHGTPPPGPAVVPLRPRPPSAARETLNMATTASAVQTPRPNPPADETPMCEPAMTVERPETTVQEKKAAAPLPSDDRPPSPSALAVSTIEPVQVYSPVAMDIAPDEIDETFMNEDPAETEPDRHPSSDMDVTEDSDLMETDQA
ncbi:hypothetical protein IWQ60_004301 [Tieghemiomyces parasiticus]|uniref:Uncharacterized protein n=1 Tax=Tieghemiomyces parasiticus TaxID=78921 RepID=A0A9W8A830_9FUNG|nr:hypothetical protein IWQ60_004301 [Tieghemiomyces parasiticus]